MKFLIFFYLSAAAIPTYAADIKAKAAACTACHGEEGISANSLWPNLAGQKEDYLLKQLKAFHERTRIDPLMSPVSQALSDQDMKDLAAYFSNLKGAR
jgi:cytochrome c553